MSKIVNKRELSLILGISERTLTEWQREGMPVVTHTGRGSANQYDTAAVIKWYGARVANGASKESAKDRLDRLRGDQVEIEIAKELRRLVAIDEIEPALGQFVADAVSLMAALPDKYTTVISEAVSPDAIHAVLEDMLVELREQLGNYEFSATLATEPAAPGDEAPAEDDAG
ncbi:terminase small subunit [Laribacter hongkongensis]|uniref:terminase small subunit n=1 Tax=Laribacter hongkongensis TaxID=168471 RepID=UPI0003F9D60B|nr:terminase small subunit [Laribacter hongkongensis]